MPSDLRDAANETATPVWLSSQRGHELLTYLQYHLVRMLARRVTLHGVLMEVYSIGVLITGESGSGKSELALELITRGHRLVADDAPEFTQIAPGRDRRLVPGNAAGPARGARPGHSQRARDVRPHGGEAVQVPAPDRASGRHAALAADRTGRPRTHLSATTATAKCSTRKVPQTTIPVAPGRNLAVLVEAAVRNHVLKTKGIDPAQTFLDRQAHQMRRQPPW